jgi:hypothetical protein
MPQSGLTLRSTAGILHVREQTTHRGLVREVHNLYGTANLQMVGSYNACDKMWPQSNLACVLQRLEAPDAPPCTGRLDVGSAASLLLSPKGLPGHIRWITDL